jgi:DNA uptake protein ComE-like DNA-binding protein
MNNKQSTKTVIVNRQSYIVYRISSGLVLVAVLWVVVVLMAIVAVVGRKARIDTMVSMARMETTRCRWACRAGMEKAIGILNEDTKESDGLTDTWSGVGGQGSGVGGQGSGVGGQGSGVGDDIRYTMDDIRLEGCYFSVQVIDEASKLNINTATKEQLLWLPNMVEEIADAIIDWRDANDTTSGMGVEGGYYENMPYRYRIRNGPFKTIRELMLVKGVTAELLFGQGSGVRGQGLVIAGPRTSIPVPGWVDYLTCYSYDKNTDASGGTRVNVNSANQNELESSLGIKRSQAKWIVDNRISQSNKKYESIGDLISDSSPREPTRGASSDPNASEPLDLQTFNRIADKITVADGQKVQGRVNVNTASDVVLTALFGGGDTAERIAEDIIAYREGLAMGMESIGEMMQAGLVDVGSFKKAANSLTTRSDVYTVRCFAAADRRKTMDDGRWTMDDERRATGDGRRATVQTEVVLDRSSNPCEVIYWYEE